MTKTSKSQPAKASAKVTDAPADSGARRSPTKTDQLLVILQTPDGVSIEELSDRFGWMQHMTRAALSGVRKRGMALSEASKAALPSTGLADDHRERWRDQGCRRDVGISDHPGMGAGARHTRSRHRTEPARPRSCTPSAARSRRWHRQAP
jgi:hypothetical protein